MTYNVFGGTLNLAQLQLLAHCIQCSVDVLCVQSWKDPQLTWDPDSYQGLSEIRLPIEYVWTPSIVLYNKYDRLYMRCSVYNSSRVLTASM